MVNPILLIGIALGTAFLLPLANRFSKRVTEILFFAALTAMTGISGQWLAGFLFQNLQPQEILTAGFPPPLAINFHMGIIESLLLTAVNFLGILGGLSLFRALNKAGVRSFVLFLVFTLGLNGLILTRDLFNLFVFLEIVSIASYALIALEFNGPALRSGFRYMIAGNLASIFLLLGIILLYALSGTLNIDGMIQVHQTAFTGTLASVGIFLLLFALIIELKQFPANGWAPDVYQSAPPGISAMFSAGSSGAILFALVKVLPMASMPWYFIIAIIGFGTFFTSNLIGLRQQHTTRLLGYSSIGQMGLILGVVGLGYYFNAFESFGLILIALFFNHFFAKAGLYWLAGLVKRDQVRDWSIIRSKPALQFIMGLFIFALLGLPPFAGFWGKWSLVLILAREQMFGWLGILLAGSLLEAVYLLRWFGHAVRGKRAEEKKFSLHFEQLVPVWIFAAFAIFSGFLGMRQFQIPLLMQIPVFATVLLFALDWLPSKIKGFLVMAVLAGTGVLLFGKVTGIPGFFNWFFLGGGFVMTITTLNRKGKSVGFYPMLLLMLLSLSALTLAKDALQFFLFWELMTLSSYALILRGRKAEQASLRYILFSLGGAYLILTGLALASAQHPQGLSLNTLLSFASGNGWIFSLLVLGFLVKVAAIGLHIWAPGAYTEAEDDVTPMLSGLLSKAGIFGLILPLSLAVLPSIRGIALPIILGWIGAFTAFFATLYAVFQEDIKKLLAWSSVGQVGYIVLGLAAMSHLGWAAALWHTVNHFLFKGLIFTAIAGVIYRTKTRNMYEMGGLIKKMPISFISVLMGIIALSGVPPLTGFGGKWLLYEALIERRWYLQTGVAFFASTIAFLYCYRLIHTIFLGMPKPSFAKVKEAPVWFLIPQLLLIAGIMLLSVFPKLILQPISAIIAPLLPSTVAWDGNTMISSLGYWNATFLMIMVGGIFVSVTVYLLLIGPWPKKVEAFNIVYAAERPERPETTHYAYDFFSAYRRAMSPVLKPIVRNFWSGVNEWTHTSASILRQVYTGNIQTYILTLLIVGIILYFTSTGVH